jgi:hypothetical protein
VGGRFVLAEALGRSVFGWERGEKFAGVYCPDGAHAGAALARGFAFFTAPADLDLLRERARLEIAAAR